MNHIDRYRGKRIPGRGSGRCQAVGTSICPAGEWGAGRRPVWETTGGFWEDFSRDPSGGCADYRLQGGSRTEVGSPAKQWLILQLKHAWKGFYEAVLTLSTLHSDVFPVLRNFWKMLNIEWLDSILHSPERTRLSWHPRQLECASPPLTLGSVWSVGY